MTSYEQALKACGDDDVSPRPAVQIATCRGCHVATTGPDLPAVCPVCGQPWGRHDLATVQSDPELRRLAGDFRLPEDDERQRLDAGAAARFERRDET